MNPLIRLIPPAFVRVFARPYVAGDSLQAALTVANELWRSRRIATTLDLLAENIEASEDVTRNRDTTLKMVDAAARMATGIDGTPANFGQPTVSLKLSSYTLDPLERGGQATTAREAAFEIAEHAKQQGVPITVDMENHHWTDFTLATLRDLHRAGHRHVGAVLQTRLHRTAQDLDMLPPGCRVRLVIGIYQEPASVAITDKRVMKTRLLDYAAILLGRGHYVEMATHDEAVVRTFLDQVVPKAGVANDAFEVQMLYGVPRTKVLDGLVARGYRARLYVPFALSWSLAVAYLRRRLDEYPAMMWLVAKNMLRRR